MENLKFEVLESFDTAIGPVVAVKYLGSKTFDTLSEINGTKVVRIQIPRKTDNDGNLIKNVWAIFLDEKANLKDFQAGKVVDAKP